ncbi:MAG: hypothetical protein IJ083_11375 [Clostridia bacterium]|nr:hypothetical protein [Clostridia bacterium]
MTHDEMETWPLSRSGFVTSFLVSGPRVTDFAGYDGATSGNQLLMEPRLRRELPRHEMPPEKDLTRAFCSGDTSRLSLPFHVHIDPGAVFVDLSEFYSTMKRVDADAVTWLYAETDLTVRATVWSWSACDVYLRGAHAGRIEDAVYKPIQRCEMSFSLKKGANPVYITLENLGVRDTHMSFALQLIGTGGLVRSALPSAHDTSLVLPFLRFLEDTRLDGGRLLFPGPAPAGAEYTCLHPTPDYERSLVPPVWTSCEHLTSLELPRGEALICLRIQRPEYPGLQRTFERTEEIREAYAPHPDSIEENLRDIYTRIAAVSSLNRGEFGFPVSNILARLHLGVHDPKDEARLLDMLSLIEARVDCADFILSGLLRLMMIRPLTGALGVRAKEVILSFRYWMDMEGMDGMCFWSENHCLMFYTCAMLAGRLYPEDLFPRAGMKGEALSAWGRGKIEDWLSDVETYGYEEFQSTVYMCVTFAALLNIVDFGGEELSERAEKLTDLLLRTLALHTFRGGIISPQGRVYRSVLYPFQSEAMALMNLADPTQPWSYGEGWLGFLASSSYRVPDGLKSLMDAPCEKTYRSGNARIHLLKTDDYCLTSVESPAERLVRWENVPLQAEDTRSHLYVKSFNERFHGTTFFRPGTWGYQQHLWTAALTSSAVLFATHPGSTSEHGDMRPGYWHGNGVMPALHQWGNELLMIYRLPDTHPLHFIHLYAPAFRFDEYLLEQHWLFVRKGKGLIAFWSSVPMEPYEGGMNAGCEIRMYGDEIACCVICDTLSPGDTLEDFASALRKSPPSATKDGGCITFHGHALTWEDFSDDTQFL